MLVLNHRFKHLGRGYHRTAARIGRGDDALLQEWNFGDVSFYAEIAASDHDAVCRRDDSIELVDRPTLFNFCHKQCTGANGKASADACEIFCVLHKRDAYPLDPLLKCKRQMA